MSPYLAPTLEKFVILTMWLSSLPACESHIALHFTPMVSPVGVKTPPLTTVSLVLGSGAWPAVCLCCIASVVAFYVDLAQVPPKWALMPATLH